MRAVDGSVLAAPILVNSQGMCLITFDDDLHVITSECVISTLRGSLYKVSVDTGEDIWTVSLGHPVFGTPALMEDRLLVPSVANMVHLVNINTGDLVSSVNTDGPVFSSPVLVSDNTVVFGCQVQ